MKINLLETHDRLLQFQDQWNVISEGCVECIKNVPDGITSPFYVFAHPRTLERDEKVLLVLTGQALPDKIPSTRLIWSPRITKPKAQTNSYLFMAKKGSDMIQTIWLLPARETWDQYEPGKMTYNQDVYNSINNFKYYRQRLEMPEKDGPNENDVENWRRVFAYEGNRKQVQKSEQNLMDNLYGSS
jgi:hypothetical protein